MRPPTHSADLATVCSTKPGDRLARLNISEDF
jgi:hypothetical protein